MKLIQGLLFSTETLKVFNFKLKGLLGLFPNFTKADLHGYTLPG